MLAGLAAVLVLAGCDSTGSLGEPGADAPAVSLDALFAPATAAEVAAVRADWGARDVTAQGATTRAAGSVTVRVGVDDVTLDVRVIEHDVPDGQGGVIRHAGAIVTPQGAAPGSLAGVVLAHGGDQGVNVDGFIGLLPFLFANDPARSTQFAYLVPAFRAEPLTFGGVDYLSTGADSPWDRDVDDALALVNVALAQTPALDPARLGVLGFSRGAGVGLLMGARDPRFAEIVAFFGPTDFFGDYVREVVEETLAGTPRELPGLDVLSRRFIEPWSRGETATEAVRLELARRSPVLVAADLPNVQLHHGTADTVVAVSQAQAMIDAMAALGRDTTTTPRFRADLYPGGGHDPATLDDDNNPFNGLASLTRASDALARLLPASAPAPRPAF